MLVDTDVMIWYMRGNRQASRNLSDLERFSVSVITYMELVQGLRNKAELNTLRSFLKENQVDILYINEEISTKAMFLIEQHYLSHSLNLADALIGATAVIYGIPLFTGNTKHYKAIDNILLKSFRP